MIRAQSLLIRVILVRSIDTRSILDGLLAIQARMYSQRNTSSGLGHYRFNHRWTKYGTIQAYSSYFRTMFRHAKFVA